MFSSKFRIVLSIGLYILLFYSIFDIYYTSPLVRGVTYDRPSTPSLVKTVVVIVADGLRFDRLFTENMEHTPILKDIVMSRGSWGLSHTRVPTESRPGHVAIFAGFYEDVASITKGWQVNAVEFDSVFNRSYQVFAWGGPDVVPMFQPLDRIDDERVNIYNYPHSMLDFNVDNLTLVDDWVVDRFAEFMTSNYDLLLSSNSSTSPKDGFRRGNLVFLHLSAADQVGHTRKPGSEEYIKTIQNIDVNIGRILNLFEINKELASETAFIFTADHGMTDWGSHGAGSLHETVTPLIIWGKHISAPKREVNLEEDSEYEGLLPFTYGLKPYNVRQADLCPLIASLLGVPIPANSVGELPLSVLDVDLPLKVSLIRTNAQQILKQLQIKYEEQKAYHYRLFFREFNKLTRTQVDSMLTNATLQASNQDYPAAIATYQNIIRLSLEGLNYYHKYDRVFMSFCVGITYAIWSLMLYVDILGQPVISVTQDSGHRKASFRPSAKSICIAVVLIFGILIVSSANQRSLLKTFYQLLPIVLALILLLVPRYHLSLTHLFGRIFSTDSTHGNRLQEQNFNKLFVLLIVLMESALWGFVYRPLLSLGAVIIGCWPFVDRSFITLYNKRYFQRIWLIACLGLAAFPTLPVVGSFASPALVLFSGICVSIVSQIFLRECRGHKPLRSWFKEPNSLLAIGALTSGFLVYLVRGLVSRTASIPGPVHLLSWILLFASPTLAICNADSILGQKLAGLTLAFFIPFNLMSMFYEGAFFLLLTVVAFMWTWFESGLEFYEFFQLRLTAESNEPSSNLNKPVHLILSNIRQPFFYVFLVVFSFFGTGNIASINTFDPVSVYCFMTILNPAAMGALIIFKMVCPIVIIGTVYASISRFTYLSHSGHNTHRIETTILMIIANFMAVHFFAMLKDEGSWLDIGESISHYVIAMSIGLASLLLSLLGRWMLSLPTEDARRVNKCPKML